MLNSSPTLTKGGRGTGSVSLVFLVIGCLLSRETGAQQNVADFVKVFESIGPLFSQDLFATITSMYTNDKVLVAGRECFLSTNPVFKSIFLIERKSKFWCPGFSPFTAVALKNTKQAADDKALKIYIQDSVGKGIIYEEELDDWTYTQ